MMLLVSLHFILLCPVSIQLCKLNADSWKISLWMSNVNDDDAPGSWIHEKAVHNVPYNNNNKNGKWITKATASLVYFMLDPYRYRYYPFDSKQRSSRKALSCTEKKKKNICSSLRPEYLNLNRENSEFRIIVDALLRSINFLCEFHCFCSCFLFCFTPTNFVRSFFWFRVPVMRFLFW